MNKPNKCKNCQWYGKPYWSIINPCDNCPMENVETFTHWVDPTIEEYKKEIERLNKDYKILKELQMKTNEANEKLKRENKIMENYLQLIIDIGYDYDGYNDVEGLKNIIDELVQYASLGKNKNDKKSMSIDGNNKRYNILGEELKEKSDINA